MDSKELDKLYRETYKMVYWTCLSLLKNKEDAEDVMQETFVTAFEAYDTLKDKSRAAAWVKRIAANKCINKLTRTRTVAVEDEFLENVEAVPDDFLPASITEDREKRSIMMGIIEDVLSEELQRTLILYYFDELSAPEISELLGVPEGTVRSRLDYAKKKIKKGVEDYEKKNNDKLYAMVLPFLTQLYMKQAEDLPFKPMPAPLADLLASGSAGVAKTAVATAIKKGNEMLIKKIIASSLAATLVAGGAVTGVYLYKKGQAEAPVVTTETVMEETSSSNGNDQETVATASKTEETTEAAETADTTETTEAAEASETEKTAAVDLSVAAYSLKGTTTYADGRDPWESYVTYNANGDVLENHTNQISFVRDTKGNILEGYVTDTDGDSWMNIKNFYDDQGQKIRSESYRKDGGVSMNTDYEYENGLLVRQTSSSEYTNEVLDYEYYDNGELKAVYSTSDGNRKLYKAYSEDGKTETEYSYDVSDPSMLRSSRVTEYDDDHKTVKGSLIYDQAWIDKRIADGLEASSNQYADYEYDADGYLRKQTTRNADGSVISTTVYEVTVY